ncbi:MAG: glycosyltransferase family 1 protein [Alphaproteobacteria bacterium]|nr:MAG: glycosyltransferase family 1 protein [Alphaproteobacteria bacterium]
MLEAGPRVLILGTRGLPAAHGGFESFAEKLSLFLVERGWRVTVYCQHDVPKVMQRFSADTWRGVERITVQVDRAGALGTIAFDWHSIRHAATQDGVCLVLGYNTALLLALLRTKGRKILINMDGIEWQRPKWSLPVRLWFYLNEWAGAWLGQRLVADHPAIADHLATRRPRGAIATIPYGGDEVTAALVAPVRDLGLAPGNYLISIARIEPDNNILPLVRAFSRHRRGAKLAVLGRIDPDNPYHAAVAEAASDEVIFPGPIYDKATVHALRFHARAHCHGHMVGGTNPSLVEALWCGNAVLAHRNRFNVWTAGAEQFFFSDTDECERMMERILADDLAVARARAAARLRAAADFDWADILSQYERELAALGGYVLVPEASARNEQPRRARLP